jgi:hypothetical protein
LAGVKGALDDPKRFHKLGNNEVCVGVAIAVKVAALVDRYAAHRELDVLTLAGIKAAEEDLVGVPLASLVGEQDAGSQLEQLGGALPRHISERADVQVEVGRTSTWRLLSAEHLNVLDVRRNSGDGLAGSRRKRGGRRWDRSWGARGRLRAWSGCGQRKVEGDADAAGDWLSRAQGWMKPPLKDRYARGLVHVGAPRFRDFSSRDVSLNIDRHVEHNVGVPALLLRRGGVGSVDAIHDLRGSHLGRCRLGLRPDGQAHEDRACEACKDASRDDLSGHQEDRVQDGVPYFLTSSFVEVMN